MISEVDVRDWDKIDLSFIDSASQILKDDGNMYHASCLNKLFNQLTEMRNSQIKAATKQIPALFKPLVAAVNKGE